MKKIRDKERNRIVRENIKLRSKAAKIYKKSNLPYVRTNEGSRKETLREISKFQSQGVEIEIKNKKNLIIWLPQRLNFSHDYEVTASYINAIRYFANTLKKRSGRIQLRSIKFDKLTKSSSSAALALTSEISRWDDEVNNRLTPDLLNWNDSIFEQFSELGYFDLFPSTKGKYSNKENTGKFKILKYIKGTVGDNDKPRELKKGVQKLIGKQSIEKWTFLHGGVGEAILNVTHHAYPEKLYEGKDRNWYLTASFDQESRDLKVSFYDHGVGIPATLPESHLREYVTRFLRRVGFKHHALMIRAALSYGRTRTEDDARGKGLQDMLQFIRQIGNGYLSIISGQGLCKVSLESSKEVNKTVGFKQHLPGTLIIWNVKIP